MSGRFFALSATLSKKWFWAGAFLAPDDPYFLKGMKGFKGTVRLKIQSGIVAGDFLGNSHGLLVVTDKVLEVWDKFDVRYETYGVCIEGRVSPFEYVGVAVLGKGGPFDPVRSNAQYEYRLREDGKPTLMGMNGLYFDEEEWDGTDLFMIPDLGRSYIITERLAVAMQKAGLTNVEYRPTETVCF